MSTIRYESNNSGGAWWLSDEDWRALEAAGWRVQWVKDDPDFQRWGATDGRWLDALATSATRAGLSEADAIAEFERVTGQNAEAMGCDCCGPPHSFYEDGDDE